MSRYSSGRPRQARLYIENVPDVVYPLPPPVLGLHVEGPGDEVLLLVLDLHHLLLDTVLGDILVYGHLQTTVHVWLKIL